jgi:predicted site-specific integrase-resolvase
MDQSSRPLLSEADVATRLQVSLQTVRRWRRLGHGPVYMKLAKFVRYRPADLDAFEATALRRETGWRARQLAA